MNRIAIFLLLAGLAGGAAIGYALRGPAVSKETTQAGAAASTSDIRKPMYWFDPMHPAQHFDKPGKSPFMDMQLVPKYPDENGKGNDVQVSARMVQSLGIRTAAVERGTLARDLRAVGSVGYDEDAVEVVQARVAGYVKRLYVRAALDRVHRGQPLVDIVAPDWVAAEEEYLALRRASPAVPGLMEAARTRLDVLGIPADQVRAIERGGVARTYTTLVAPIDGVVTELGARDGMAVAPGTPLFRINGLGRVWITAEIPEAQAARAHQGSAVSISVPAWPGRAFPARVSAVLPNVAAATRTLQVRIEAANSDGALTPGMYASVAFEVAPGEPQLLVPSEAVIRTGTRVVVIVADVAGFRPVEVRTGGESGGKTEILDGLEEGERIVSSGQFLIDSEAGLRATLSRMSNGATEPTP